MELQAAKRQRHPSQTRRKPQQKMFKVHSICLEASHQETRHISEEQNKNGATKLYGYVLAKKRRLVHRILKDHLVSLWSDKGAKEIIIYECGSFMVEFFNSEDRDNVLADSPWWFSNRMLHLLSVPPDLRTNSNEAETIPLWIQIHKIPEDCFNEGDIRRATADFVGHPSTIQLSSGTNELPAFTARVKVLFPKKNPVLPRIKIKNQRGQGYDVPVEFELEIICSRCLSILHRSKDCPRKAVVSSYQKSARNTDPPRYSGKLLSGNNRKKEIEQPQQKPTKMYPRSPIPLQQKPNPSSPPARINMYSPGIQPRREEGEGSQKTFPRMADPKKSQDKREGKRRTREDYVEGSDGAKELEWERFRRFSRMADPDKSQEKRKGKKRIREDFDEGSDGAADELEWERFRRFIRDYISRSKSPVKLLEEMVTWVRELCDKIEKEYVVKAVEKDPPTIKLGVNSARCARIGADGSKSRWVHKD